MSGARYDQTRRPLQNIHPNILSPARTIPSPTSLAVRRVQSNAEAVFVSQPLKCRQWASEAAGSATRVVKAAAAANDMRFDIRDTPQIVLNIHVCNSNFAFNIDYFRMSLP
jgi:hypothetical protein